MSKKFIFLSITIVAIVSYLLDVEKILFNKIRTINNSISTTYIDFFLSSAHTINKYFNQLNYIDTLKKSQDLHLHYKLLYDTTQKELEELNKKVQLNLDETLQYKKVKVLSYHTFNDHSKVFIDFTSNDSEKIYPLITLDGYSAGIVLTQENQKVAFLNENAKSNYTVFIGENNAPGITSGIDNKGNIIIKYVPIYKEIQKEDEVITSSMDRIFPFGIKVGKVVDIINHENTKEVIVEPYAKTLGERYFFITSKNNTNNEI